MIVEESEPALQLVGFDAGGGYIYHLNGEPFTGMIVFRHLNGNKAIEMSFVEGFVCGLIRDFNQNGSLICEYYKKLNRIYGPYTTWDQNGIATTIETGPEP